MKISLFDHHNTPYPIQQYGGIERIIQNLFTYLVDKGIDTTLIINNNNPFKYKTGKVIQIPFKELEDIRYGRKAVSNYTDADIFHAHTSGCHQSFDFTNFKGKWVSTCQGYKEDAAAPYQVFVSENQYKQHITEYDSQLRSGICYLAYNGIDTSVLYDTKQTRNKIIWFGGIRYDKNAHILHTISKAIGEKIHVYGNIQDESYFNYSIKPYLDKFLIYHGPINGEEAKRTMFNEAILTIHTANEFQDPCPLAVLESQACGTPVVGFKSGSLPEIVLDSNTNLSSNIDELILKIKTKNYNNNTTEIQNWVGRRFSIDSLGKTYQRIYTHVLEDNIKE